MIPITLIYLNISLLIATILVLLFKCKGDIMWKLAIVYTLIFIGWGIYL